MARTSVILVRVDWYSGLTQVCYERGSRGPRPWLHDHCIPLISHHPSYHTATFRITGIHINFLPPWATGIYSTHSSPYIIYLTISSHVWYKKFLYQTLYTAYILCPSSSSNIRGVSRSFLFSFFLVYSCIKNSTPTIPIMSLYITLLISANLFTTHKYYIHNLLIHQTKRHVLLYIHQVSIIST